MDDDRKVDSVNMVKPSGLKNKLKTGGSGIKLNQEAKDKFKSQIMTSLTMAAKKNEMKKKEIIYTQKKAVQIVEPLPKFKPFKSKIKRKRAPKAQGIRKQTVIVLDMNK